MSSFSLDEDKILSLRKRAITTIVDNYCRIFNSRPEVLDFIPKPLRKEIFTRLVYRGILPNELFARVIDKFEVLLDLKSVMGLNDASCQILSRFGNIRTLFLTEVGASIKALNGMFSHLHQLRKLEISKTETLDDSVLDTLAINCPCIKVLIICKTGITDIGIQSLADNSISLIALDISYTNVSYSGIERLMASPTGQTLKELKCRRCQIIGRQEILSTILGFRKLEDYSFSFDSSDDADWVLERVTTRLRNFAFNIPL